MRAPYQVARPAVVERMQSDGTGQLVLVRAPAGFGKTTVMRQCREALIDDGVATAWLTLDPADNDVNRFLGFLSVAFDAVVPGPPMEEVLGESATGELALGLMDRVAGCRQRFVIFLDDFESVQNSTVLGLVRELVDHLPEGCRLIIGSRVVPDLGFGRLRAQGRLLEIEPPDLRFSLDETVRFLRECRGLPLDDGQIARLHGATEGWAAALWLASMALERRADPDLFIDRFSGSTAAITDYLAEDVFGNLPETLRQFLLRTSILKQLNGALCDAVTGGDNGEALLAELHRRNLFIVPMNEEQSWFRYHSLFRDFLQGQLERSLPEEIPVLHRAAALWYCEQQRPVAAIEHALASEQTELALEMLTEHAERLLLEGRFRLLSRWLTAVPSEALDARPLLKVVLVWALAFSRGYKEGLAVLESMDTAALPDPQARAHVLSVRPMLLTMMDQVECAYAEARDNLRTLKPGVNFPYSMLANSYAYLAMVKGYYQEACGFLEESRRAQEGGTGLFSMIYSEVVEATIDLLQGRLRQATRRFSIAAATRPGEGHYNTNGNVMAGIPLAEVLYESNRIEQAERLLTVYVPLIRGVRLPDQMISAHVTMARIAALKGGRDTAFQLLTELEYLGYQGQLPRVVASARLERLRQCLVSGDVAGARAELARTWDKALWERVTPYSSLGNDVETLTLSRLRLLTYGRAPLRAVGPLRQAVAETEAGQRHRRALKLRMLLAGALGRGGRTEEALAELLAALRLAAVEGFIRIAVDEGDAVTDLIRLLAARPEAAELPGDYLQRLLAACGMGAVSGQPEGASSSTELMEPLTRKERLVLERLAEGHSNGGIAKALFVSESTVRTHLRNINAKLNARNRTEAVAIARRLGLVA